MESTTSSHLLKDGFLQEQESGSIFFSQCSVTCLGSDWERAMCMKSGTSFCGYVFLNGEPCTLVPYNLSDPSSPVGKQIDLQTEILV